MRLAAMLLGFFGSLIVIVQGFVASSLFSAGHDEKRAGATAGGFFAGVIGLVASALVMAFPLFSAILFVICGLIGYAAAAGGFSDMWIHGTAYLVLAVMAFFGLRGKKKDARERAAEKARQEERDAQLMALLSTQHGSDAGVTCSSCGQVSAEGSTFCASCGAPLSTQTQMA